MQSMTILVGARPNYMKAAPLWRAARDKAPHVKRALIHSGQHYDQKMSDVFFGDLAMPEPDVCLNVGSGSHADQTGRVMIALEPVLVDTAPDILVVVGDVNSTLAGALTAVKLGIPVAHIEAGLRSSDRTMPEEINRLATDAVADILLTSCRDADANLIREGVSEDKIHFVGNIMIDSLVGILPHLEKSNILENLGLENGSYISVTLHRPSNVDDPEKLSEILGALDELADRTPVIFPVHPRTGKAMEQAGWRPTRDGLRLLEPLGYVDFMRLMTCSAAVITDSGGIQEETSYLGIPCLTVRENTERPVTISQGTNRLVGASKDEITAAAEAAIAAGKPETPTIELWDGKTAGRILDVLLGIDATPSF